jgi:hypothetical protein
MFTRPTISGFTNPTSQNAWGTVQKKLMRRTVPVSALREPPQADRPAVRALTA